MSRIFFLKVKRIMSNTETSDLKKAAAFYGDVLGLDLIMDHGWFQTYGSDAKMTVQVSFGSEGGSGTPVPNLSIEVDDLAAALAKVKKANIPLSTDQLVSLGVSGDSMSDILRKAY